jgi:hypothetical protein
MTVRMTQRNYFDGGPLDGCVFMGASRQVVEDTPWPNDRYPAAESGRYALVEMFVQASEFLPGKHAVAGDAWYRWQPEPVG